MDFSLSDVLVGLIGLVGVILTLRQNKKLNPVHRQLTVNHHSSREPTVLDRLDNIETRLDRHIDWHAHKERERE